MAIELPDEALGAYLPVIVSPFGLVTGLRPRFRARALNPAALAFFLMLAVKVLPACMMGLLISFI
jgi:hypothetical protein